MTTWFTSDLHIGHRNILKYCPNRPFTTIEEHDAALLAEWEDKIAPQDDVYFLGDLTPNPNPDEVMLILMELTGRIHVVLGNHDRALKKLRAEANRAGMMRMDWRGGVLDHVQFMRPDDRIEGFYRKKIDGRSLVLNHYPLEEWPGMGDHGRGDARSDPLTGRWHLHGHSHAAGRRIPARLDVGWDTANKILSWEDVVELVEAGAC